MTTGDMATGDTSAADEFVVANAESAQSFRGGLPSPPSRQVAVVTCMDARIDVYAVLGLQPGQAHVLRNAGGVVTDDVLRSLTISQRLLGTREIVLIHHSGCGMQSFTDDEFKASIEGDVGIRPAWAAEAFGDLDADVRQSIARVRACPFLPHKDAVRGFVLDVSTGRLAEVG